MTITISTSFVPYKLIMHSGRPVTLEVRIRNNSQEKKLMSVGVDVPPELSLNASGYAHHKEERIGEIAPGKEVLVRFLIYPRPTTPPGRYPIVLRIMEHEGTYQLIASESQKQLVLQVVE